MPLFVDTFGTSKNKSMWMAMMMLAPSLGVITGYIATAICIMKADWRFSFSVQAATSLAMVAVIVSIPSDYLELSRVQMALQKEIERR